MVAELTNVHFRGAHENISMHKDITRREGHLICNIEKAPPLPDQDPRELIPNTIGNADARWNVGNVDCSIYANEERREAQVAHLRSALRALAQTVPASGGN